MVGRRPKRTRLLAASHQRSWLWGRHAVLELLASGRWPPLEVRIADRLDADVRAAVLSQCAALGCPVESGTNQELTRWCGSREHQGLLALLPPYPYAALDAALAAASPVPLFLILDRLQDPHNFGAILRAADVFGVDAVFVGAAAQCEVTPHVVRSSAGSVQHLTLCRVDALSELPAVLRTRCGVATWAAAGAGALALPAGDWRGPLALVIGNEGTGIAPDLAARCAGTVSIPQFGRVASLNAAVAAGVLLYEVRRQRSLARSH